MCSFLIFNENKLRIGHGLRDAREDLIKLRPVHVKRAPAPEHDPTRPQADVLAAQRWQRVLEWLVVIRQVRQPDQLLGIMVIGIGGLHQVAAEEEINGRIATRLRVSPRRALDRCQALCRQHRCLDVHADLRIDQNVERISENLPTPLLDRVGTLYEPFAMLERQLGFGVDDRPSVIAKQTKPAAVELGDPSLQRNLPDRMPPVETGDEPDTHRLVRRGRWRQRRAWIALRDQPASKRAMDRLQMSIVPALIRQIKGQVTSETVHEVRYRAALEIVAELIQMLFEKPALAVNFLIVVVEHRQLGCADRKARFGILRIERTNFAVAALCLLATAITIRQLPRFISAST